MELIEPARRPTDRVKIVRARNSIVAAVVCLIALVVLPTGATAQEEEPGHRLVGLLEYVGADYKIAVRDGEVVDDFEYEEQKMLVQDARELLSGGAADTPELREKLDRLANLVEKKASPQKVGDAAMAAKSIVVEAYDIQLHPEQAPNFRKGRELYAKHCASCHGSDGRADVPTAEGMKPPPANFRSADRRSALSPYRIFNTTRFGIEGTPMKPYSELSESERWDLAFYVLALAHGREDARAKEASPPRDLPDALDTSIESLAKVKESELESSLTEAGFEGSEVGAAMAYLRGSAPYSKQADELASSEKRRGIAFVRLKIDEAETAWKSGDADRARRAVLAAYLEGFEPIESRLATVDPSLVKQTEKQFLALRRAIRAGDDATVPSAFQSTHDALDRAETALAQRDAGWWTTAVASSVILLREGVEVVLLIALLLGLLARLGRRDAERYVHIGWVSALVAGGLTWVAAEKLIAISGAGRELLEGVVGLLAAAVLFSVSYWFLSQLHGQKWMTYLKEKLEESVSGGHLLAVGGLSFLAVYREAFETVLFYQALAIESGGQAQPILAGIAVAAVLLAVIAYFILAAGQKLPMKQFFAVSGVLLLGLSFVLTGHGLHAFVEAGIFPSHPVPVFTVEALGIYPELVPVIGQLIVVVAVATWATWSFFNDA